MGEPIRIILRLRIGPAHIRPRPDEERVWVLLPCLNHESVGKSLVWGQRDGQATAQASGRRAIVFWICRRCIALLPRLKAISVESVSLSPSGRTRYTSYRVCWAARERCETRGFVC